MYDIFTYLLGLLKPGPEHFIYGLSLPRSLRHVRSWPKYHQLEPDDNVPANHPMAPDSHRQQYFREHWHGACTEECIREAIQRPGQAAKGAEKRVQKKLFDIRDEHTRSEASEEPRRTGAGYRWRKARTT